MIFNISLASYGAKEKPLPSFAYSVENGQVDAVIAGMTITEEKKDAVDFSKPYYTATQVMIVKEDSKITKAADMADKKIVVIQGYTGETCVKNMGYKYEAFKKGTEAILELVNGKTPLLIEFKCKNLINCENLCETANKILSEYKGKYFVQSFYPFVLKWYRKNRPDILRGQLSEVFKGEKLYKKMLGNMLFNFISRPHFISYGHHFSKNKIMFKLVKMLGGFPIGWTFKKNETLENAKKDFKAFIFEEFIP